MINLHDMREHSRRATLLGAASMAGAGLLTLGASQADAAVPFRLRSRAETVRAFSGQWPRYWGLNTPGVRTRFSTNTAAGRNAVCLTFDACGGRVTRYDAKLIATLRSLRVPATLFINRTWATNNPTTFRQLLADPLFEIENHGHAHIPLSVIGRSAYGIRGTGDVGGVWQEIAGCYWYMGRYFDHNPRFMRAGTAYVDDVAARAATFMGQTLVNFSINGDAGASYPASTVAREVSKARAGDIVICHMNHPGGGTAAGIAKAVPALRAKGVVFRRLREVL